MCERWSTPVLTFQKMSSLPRSKPTRTATHFMCYLLRSLAPKHATKTYIGFAVDPKRRIRQHNGEIKGGATRTKRVGRPWEMCLVVQGFPNKVCALQFEWAWTNPTKSRLLKNHVPKTKRYGYREKLRLLTTMLTVNPWSNYGLKVHFTSEDVLHLWEKFRSDNTALMSIPVSEGLLDMLDVYNCQDAPTCVDKEGLNGQPAIKDKVCVYCSEPMKSARGHAKCPYCNITAHLICLSDEFLKDQPDELIPRSGVCSFCEKYITWRDIVVKGSLPPSPRGTPARKPKRTQNKSARELKKKNIGKTQKEKLNDENRCCYNPTIVHVL